MAEPSVTVQPTLDLTPRLDLRVSPALVASIELLALPLPDLEELVERMLAGNPALERVDRPACPGCGGRRAGHDGARCDARLPRRPSSPPEDGADPWPATAHRPSAAELLLAEVAPLLATGDRWLAAYVLADLDDRGFLDRPAGAIATRLGVGANRVERVIQAVRAVGPPGICAVDATDCLLRQLEPFEARGQAPTLLRAMIAGHLGDLARGRIGAVALALGTGRAEVLAARAFLRENLRPWATLPEPSPPPVVAPPDLVLRDAPGDPDRLEVEVVETDRLAVRLDPAWARLVDQGPGLLPAAQHQRVGEQVASAQAFLSGLARRTSTLARVAGFAAERQLPYLRQGPAAHLPLTRTAVAEALGLHESTVSRAVAGKRLRLPDGRVLALAELFGAARSAHDSLRAVVCAEDRPLSDGELTLALRARGHDLSRRTVTKYRHQLGIPPRALR
jgi:RNA polymerase sigma-54 factor